MKAGSALKVRVLRQHRPHAARLASLLGEAFDVQGAAAPTADADVLVTTHLSPDEAATTQARLIQVPGAGTEGIAWQRLPAGCLGANVYCHEIPIAEYVLHAALSHVLRAHAPLALTAWSWPSAYLHRPLRGEIHGQRMTVVGTGHIGQEIAHRARAFGMTLVGVNRSGRAAAGFDRTLPVTRLDEALPNTDVLVLCCPLDDSTRQLIDGRRLGLLPHTSLLVNVARGEVVHEQALYLALRDRTIAAAALDVWYRYPAADDQALAPSAYPFDELDNASMTAHISGWSRGLIERRYQAIARNILRLAAGERPANQMWPPSPA
ncbi:glycerate dehydrogenase [Bordetella ansorpii]|uniref:Glycerate dehydrogenase n=1 Tax=Bordetella ansorpii TaxID=288768 RepID=A0A157RPM7_9BORD|nr:2-hydroxyacid dehydrogenase [Bordetella ansorpii]SAI59816.1 glycerate dehydrogenase [Bordetella ansorpii]